jgi:hypothetical protein
LPNPGQTNVGWGVKTGGRTNRQPACYATVGGSVGPPSESRLRRSSWDASTS